MNLFELRSYFITWNVCPSVCLKLLKTRISWLLFKITDRSRYENWIFWDFKFIIWINHMVGIIFLYYYSDEADAKLLYNDKCPSVRMSAIFRGKRDFLGFYLRLRSHFFYAHSSYTYMSIYSKNIKSVGLSVCRSGYKKHKCKNIETSIKVSWFYYISLLLFRRSWWNLCDQNWVPAEMAPGMGYGIYIHKIL